MLPMPKSDILQRRVHELVLGALARRVAHAREPERVEHVRVGVHRVVVVRRPRRRRQQRPDIFQR